MPGMKKGSSMEKTKPQQYSCETCVKSAVIPLSRLPPRTGIIPSISFLLKGARGTTDEVKVWSGSDPRIQVRQYLDWPHKREVEVCGRRFRLWAKPGLALEDAVLLRRPPVLELPDDRDPNERWLAHPRDGVAKRRSAGWRIT